MPARDLLRFVYAAAAGAMPPIAVVAPRALALLLPLAAAAAAIAGLRQRHFAPPPWMASLLFVLLLLWGGASALWTVDVALTWRAWRGIAAAALAGLLLLGMARRLDDESRAAIGTAALVGVAIGLAFLSIEIASAAFFARSLGSAILSHPDFSEAVFNRAAVTLVLVLWPAAMTLQARRGLVAAAVLIAGVALVLSWFDSMAALLGLIGGAVVWLAANRRPRATALALALVITLGTATAPLVPRTELATALATGSNHSVAHRAEIWRFVAESIAERPVLGWGLNVSRALPGANEDVASVPGKRLPLHPHNAILQVWVELGAVGAALALAVLLLALRAARGLKAPPPHPNAAPAAALALIASAVSMAAVSYGLWQSWWMAALWLAAALMAATAGAPPRAPIAAR